jgi:hypothetical protein
MNGVPHDDDTHAVRIRLYRWYQVSSLPLIGWLFSEQILYRPLLFSILKFLGPVHTTQSDTDDRYILPALVAVPAERMLRNALIRVGKTSSTTGTLCAIIFQRKCIA